MNHAIVGQKINYIHMKINYALIITLAMLCISCKEQEKNMAMPTPEIAVVELIPQSISIFEEYVGQIYGNKDIPIRARVEGYLEGIHFEEGRRVKKGDLLYVIDASPFVQNVAAEKSHVSKAQTNLIQAESNLARIEPLAKIDAISQRDLDNARAQRDAAKSELNAALANLGNSEINLSYAKILAPINGVIGKTMAKVGEFVGRDPNPVILNTVSNIDSIRVEFFLSEIEYLKIARTYREESPEKKKNRKQTAIQLILADGSLYEQDGVINFIDRSVNASTGAILIQGTFPNPSNIIRPGQFARVKIKAQEIEDALMVPQKSVTELQGKFSVFIVGPENKIENKTIELNGKKGRYYIVSQGLNANDKVVIEGLQKIRTGLVVKPKVVEFEGANTLND